MKARLFRLFSSRSFRLALGAVVSGLSLYLALRNVTFGQVWAALSQARFAYVGLALASVALTVLAKAVRWKVLLGPAGAGTGTGKLLMAVLAGHSLNTLYPARVGDLSRAYLIGGMGAGRVFTLGTILVEKLLDTLAYTLLFFLLIFWMPLPAWVNDSAYTFAGVVILASLMAASLAYRPARFLEWLRRLSAWLPLRLREPLLRHLGSALSSLEILQGGPALLWLAFWSAFIWSMAILTNYLTLLALGLDLPLPASLLVLVALQAGISIPSVPGRIGVFEAICVLALAIFGVEQAPALSYGIVLHSIVFLPTTLLGLLFLWRLGMSPGVEAERGLETS